MRLTNSERPRRPCRVKGTILCQPTGHRPNQNLLTKLTSTDLAVTSLGTDQDMNCISVPDLANQIDTAIIRYTHHLNQAEQEPHRTSQIVQEPTTQ